MLLQSLSLTGLLRAPPIFRLRTPRTTLRSFVVPAQATHVLQSFDEMQVDNPLVPQAFASSTLDRSAGDKRDPAFVTEALHEALLLFVNGKGVCVRNVPGPVSLYWAGHTDLAGFQLAIQPGSSKISSTGTSDICRAL